MNFLSVFYKEIFGMAAQDINVNENYDIQKVLKKYIFAPCLALSDKLDLCIKFISR